MDEQIILDIKIDSAEATRNIKEAQDALAALKAQQADLDKQLKDHTITEEEYYKQTAQCTEGIIAQKDAIKANTDVIKQNVKEQKNAEGSLTQMRAQLKQMVSAYDNMSKAERESEKTGGALLKKIQEQTAAIQSAEEASGRHQRNVGNYPKVFDLASTSMGRMLGAINGLTAAAPANANGLKAITSGIKQTNAALLKLLLNPIVAIIAAVVLAIMGLVKVIKMVVDEMKSMDDTGTALQGLLAAFQPIIDIFRKALSAVAIALGEVVKGITKVITAVTSLIPAFKASAQEAQSYVSAMDALEEADREFVVQKAKNNKEIADLQSKAIDKEKYTAEQRAAFLKRAQDLEKQNLATERKNEAERLRLKEQEFLKQHGWETKKGEDRQKALQRLSDDQKNELAQMRAHLIDLEAAQDEHTRKMRQKEIAANEEAKREQEAAQQKRREAWQKHLDKMATMADNELAAVRALEDARLAAMEEGEEKQLRAAELAYQRSVEDLNKQVEEQRKAGTLSAKAANAINARLIELEIAYEKKKTEIMTAANVERNKKMHEDTMREAERQRKEQETQAKAEAVAEKIKQLQELQAVENNERERLAVQARYADEEYQQKKAEYDALVELYKEYTDEQKELTAEQQLALNTANLAMIESDKKRSDEQKKIADYDKRVQKAKYDAIMGAVGGLGDILDAFAEDNKAAAIASKAIALGQIAVETGIALATGIAQSQSVPYPANLVAMATTIATVLGGIASAITTVKGAKFAHGGLVQGAGTETSDSIPARLSNGESVITAKATRMFYDQLSAMNVAGGGVPFPKSGNKRAFATGGVVSADALESTRQTEQMAAMIENIQPVVSVREITNVSNRVKVKERIALT